MYYGQEPQTQAVKELCEESKQDCPLRPTRSWRPKSGPALLSQRGDREYIDTVRTAIGGV